jgi:hypothetical protein
MTEVHNRDQVRGARILFLRTAPRLVSVTNYTVDAGPPRALIRPNQHTTHIRQEPIVMNGSNTTLIHALAMQRAIELRSEAQRDRLFSDLGRQNGVPTPIGRARRAIGNILVRTGNLVGGDRDELQPAEPVAGATILHIAR